MPIRRMVSKLTQSTRLSRLCAEKRMEGRQVNGFVDPRNVRHGKDVRGERAERIHADTVLEQ